MKKYMMEMSTKSTKKLICFYQKRLTKKQEKLQKPLTDVTPWQSKSALQRITKETIEPTQIPFTEPYKKLTW